MTKERPRHPGAHIKEEWLQPRELTVTAAAQQLGVNRKTLSQVVNENAGVSPEMAYRLEKVMKTPARVWLARQMEFDLANVDPQSVVVPSVRRRKGLNGARK